MMSLIIILVLLILLGIAAFVLLRPLGGGSDYLPNAEELRRLRSTPVGEDEKGRKVFGRATHEVRGGLNVLKLRGSHYEMGYQHGVLLREEVRRGAVRYFARPADNFAPYKHMSRMRRWYLARHFDWTIYRPLLKCSPKQYLAELKGLADGSGLAFADIFRGNMLSELNMNLVKFLGKRTLRQRAASGCTGFVAFGSATADANLIMGRNTDYSGGGLWDKHQTVVFYEPEDGLRFANVSTAGIIKCNSCMNEKGLCLGGHFLFLSDTRPDGVGFTFFELEIMKRASTIKEAHTIVAGNPRAGAFAFLLADGKTNEAAVIEANASSVAVRRPEDSLIWETNIATTKEIRPTDVFVRSGTGKNPIARYERMRMLLHENRGKITPQLAAQFMGDHMDMCSDSMRPVGGIISQISNMTSAVFCPSRFDFWVADGLAPVCNNTFFGFNLMGELADEASVVEPDSLAPNDYVRTRDYEALRKYYEAMVKFTIPPTDIIAALDKLEEAIALRPEEAIYRRIAAKMLLRQGKAAEAAEHLKKTLECVQSPSERAQAHLLLGFSNDLLGMRSEAVDCYQEALKLGESGKNDVLSAVSPSIFADARKYSQAPFTLEDADKIEENFQIAGRYDI